MSDLVERLRDPQYEHAGTAAPRLDAYTTVRIMKEAADRIDALEKERDGFLVEHLHDADEENIRLSKRVEALEAALREITAETLDVRISRIARATLAPEQDK